MTRFELPKSFIPTTPGPLAQIAHQHVGICAERDDHYVTYLWQIIEAMAIRAAHSEATSIEALGGGLTRSINVRTERGTLVAPLEGVLRLVGRR